MNKNIIIIILLGIIVFLLIKILNPTVVTSRKVTQYQPQQITVTTVSPETKPLKQAPQNTNSYQNKTAKKYRYYTGQENIQPVKPTVNKQYAPVYQTNQSVKSAINKQNTLSYQPQQPVYRETRPIYNQRTEYSQYPKQEYRPAQKPLQTIKQNSLENNIKTCKPYSENMSTEYMGMKMDYKIEILGWQNNKCILNFTSNINGAGSSFENQYGVNASDVQIVGFAPKIRCAFSKEQLKYVGDSILQEEERNNGAQNNMLKNPNNINLFDINAFSGSDAKLLQVIMGDRACEITNLQDLNNMFEGLLDMF